MTKASDKIWDLVCGIAGESNRRNRKIMVFQAYIDESADGNLEKALVLSGYLANAERWAAFSDEWDSLNKRDYQGAEFKMRSSHKHPRKVSAYYSLIEKYDLCGMACIISIPEMKSALSRVITPYGMEDIRKLLNNPYFIGSRTLLANVANGLPEIEVHEPVDFIFDEKIAEKPIVLDGWEALKATASKNLSERLAGSLTFSDSQRLMPLQAADLISGLIQRHETAKGKWNGEIPYRSSKSVRMILARPTEEDMFKVFSWILSHECAYQAVAFGRP